ncbi:MAG TPA: hypothetical protein VLA56_07580 [Pseudomonadales bacterium]|nr:hypothetical protein [Pseudomonadales bacterium]
MPGARRNWWKPLQAQPRRSGDERGRAPAAFAPGAFDDSVDSPLCRARVAARSQRLAEELAALEHRGARPDLIVELRNALISVRAQLCGAL